MANRFGCASPVLPSTATLCPATALFLSHNLILPAPLLSSITTVSIVPIVCVCVPTAIAIAIATTIDAADSTATVD